PGRLARKRNTATQFPVVKTGGIHIFIPPASAVWHFFEVDGGGGGEQILGPKWAG
ncbi:Hypothetical predicted protein, partial [Olea europaea subsp. europaea]